MPVHWQILGIIFALRSGKRRREARERRNCALHYSQYSRIITASRCLFTLPLLVLIGLWKISIKQFSISSSFALPLLAAKIIPKYTMPMNWHYTSILALPTNWHYTSILALMYSHTFCWQNKISLIWNFPLSSICRRGRGRRGRGLRGRWRSMNWPLDIEKDGNGIPTGSL